MSNKIIRNVERTPGLIRNLIDEQTKTNANALSLEEWNYIINVLKTQANVNTAYLEMLHKLLFGDWSYDTGSETLMFTFDDPTIGLVKQIEINYKHLIALIKEDINNFKQQVSDEIQSLLERIPFDFLDSLQEAFPALSTRVDNLESMTQVWVGSNRPPIQYDNVLWFDINEHIFSNLKPPIVHFQTSTIHDDTHMLYVFSIHNPNTIQNDTERSIITCAATDVHGISLSEHFDDTFVSDTIISGTPIPTATTKQLRMTHKLNAPVPESIKFTFWFIPYPGDLRVPSGKYEIIIRKGEVVQNG